MYTIPTFFMGIGSRFELLKILGSDRKLLILGTFRPHHIINIMYSARAIMELLDINKELMAPRQYEQLLDTALTLEKYRKKFQAPTARSHIRRLLERYYDKHQDIIEDSLKEIMNRAKNGIYLNSLQRIIMRRIPRKTRNMNTFFQIRHTFGVEYPVGSYWVYPFRFGLRICFCMPLLQDETLRRFLTLISKILSGNLTPRDVKDLDWAYTTVTFSELLQNPKVPSGVRIVHLTECIEHFELSHLKIEKNMVKMRINYHYNYVKLPPLGSSEYLKQLLVGCQKIVSILRPFTKSEKASERLLEIYDEVSREYFT